MLIPAYRNKIVNLYKSLSLLAFCQLHYCFFETIFKSECYHYMKQFFIRLIDSFRNLFRHKDKSVTRHAADNDYEYNRKRAEKRAELDRILDKISRYGKESLTKNEREFLNNSHGL